MNATTRNKQSHRLPIKLALAISISLMFGITAQANETKLMPLDSTELDNISAGGASITVVASAGAMGDHTLAVTGSHARVQVKDRCEHRAGVVAGSGWAVALGTESGAVAVVDANISGSVTAARYMSRTLSRPGRSVARTTVVLMSR